jgi:rhodanese-related sulfurtransferase
MYVVDIRPREERYGAIGFVPGSRSVPTEVVLKDVEAFASAFEPDATLVFVCASGRRSAALAEQLAPRMTQSIATLEGGTLGWGAHSLPLCGIHTPQIDQVPMVPSLEKFPRIVLSCFAAETVENALDGRVHGDLDPAAVIEAAFKRECGDEVTPRCLEAALERVAEVARRSGYKLARIQENVDGFRSAIARLAALRARS